MANSFRKRRTTKHTPLPDIIAVAKAHVGIDGDSAHIANLLYSKALEAALYIPLEHPDRYAILQLHLEAITDELTRQEAFKDTGEKARAPNLPDFYRHHHPGMNYDRSVGSRPKR